MNCRLVDAGTDVRRSVIELKTWLRQRNRWLVIFDNVEIVADLAPWIPQGPGHIIITTKNFKWQEMAMPIEVEVFTRAESISLLRGGISNLNENQASELADALGDLPLALAQAVGLLTETRLPVEDYLRLLSTSAAQIMNEGLPPSYPVPLGAAVRLSSDRLRQRNESALQLLQLCAFMGSEPIPLTWFSASEAVLLNPLATTVRDVVRLHQAAGLLLGFGLAKMLPDGLLVHPLVQSVLRDQMVAEEQELFRGQVDRVLATANPREPENSVTWPAWAQLLPHLISTGPGASSNPGVRDAACEAVWYLLSRGDAKAAREFSISLVRQWRSWLGPDDEHTTWATHNLARAWRDLGEYEEARRLHAILFAKDKQIRGEDDPATLSSASSLAIDLRRLGKLADARMLDEDTLARRRRVHGDDHPATSASATNLAADLRELGAPGDARMLDEDTLARRRRVHGDDHPATLGSAN
ncbi:FxSxx-COOH system tetratricopeptide repeat protein, partial [Streptomyces sp. H39-C1]|uniref:FxSxx-COOH system tetratricopeptide repeat protein n=1 Tax=Streptomyces sp. H39-C1 TaxID=3004355 RepID=UPI0022B00448